MGLALWDGYVCVCGLLLVLLLMASGALVIFETLLRLDVFDFNWWLSFDELSLLAEFTLRFGEICSLSVCMLSMAETLSLDGTLASDVVIFSLLPVVADVAPAAALPFDDPK